MVKAVIPTSAENAIGIGTGLCDLQPLYPTNDNNQSSDIGYAKIGEQHVETQGLRLGFKRMILTIIRAFFPEGVADKSAGYIRVTLG